MTADSKTTSPTERLMRKRLAARLRQQRCRARKKELSLAKKQREQHEVKDPAHVPIPARRHILVPRNHAPSNVSRPYPPPPQSIQRHQVGAPTHKTHQPHRPQQPHRPHHPHQPHRAQMPHQLPRQIMHVPPPPPPHHLHPHHHRPHIQPHYAAHRPVRPLFITEPPTRMQSIGSVVSFDDGSCPPSRVSFDNGNSSMPRTSLLYAKQEQQFPCKHEHQHYSLMQPSSTAGPVLVVPTVSPTMSSKPVVEPDKAACMIHQVPSRSPTKEETAIDAMLSLRSASFGA